MSSSVAAGSSHTMQEQVRHAFPLDQFSEAVRRVREREVLKAILLPQKAAEEAAA